jgi:parallel beta-helix repeat protein
MKKLMILAMVFLMLLIAAPVNADPGTLYVDDDGLCDGNSPCYTHPQDAVNAANPGDTIKVYPGTYGSRQFTSPVPPHWGPSDQYAPALIVWKDGLTIEAVDPDPSKTVIQTTYNFWVNPAYPAGGGGGSIEHSTGCTWNSVTKAWDGTCVRPTFGTAPNAVAIIASNVTIRGFTIHRPFDYTDGTYNTAGVMIGALCAGCSQFLGSNNNTVENCAFSDVWHAVYIWHSSGNRIVNNTVAVLNTNHWAAISTYDGYNDAQIGLGNLSENNFIAHNTLDNKGIALGAWAPTIWTSNAGSKVCSNTTTQVGVSYAHGPVIIGCNGTGFWQFNTDNVLRIKGVTYTGDTELWNISNVDVNLSAQLAYDGSADGSGVEVAFTVNSTEYHATTVTGGTASTTANLPPGIYTVETKVTVCGGCEFTDTDTLVIGQIVAIDIKPGSDPNSINLGSKGVVPVAVLTTDDFDASTVDPGKVEFAGASPVRWTMEDVDGDGDVDLLFHFKTQELQLDANSTEATLTGATTDGTPIEGTDTVKIVPKGK